MAYVWLKQFNEATIGNGTTILCVDSVVSNGLEIILHRHWPPIRAEVAKRASTTALKQQQSNPQNCAFCTVIIYPTLTMGFCHNSIELPGA